MDFMDFRWDDRQPKKMNVTLACGNKSAVSGTTQNISNGGMYVATDVSDVDLYAHCMVTIQMTDASVNDSDNLLAMVAYKDDKGIGLMFYGDNERLINTQ